MFELVKINDRDYYIQSPVKVGLVKLNETDVFIVDSGIDKDAGKKILKVIDENGWRLKFIFNTHSHADHIGANAFLQEKTGCKVYTTGVETAFTRHTCLEPSLIYGGFPCKDLRHKFLLAKESDAQIFTQDILPGGFEVISLAGHCPDMSGLKTPCGTVYLGDCLSSKATIDKYGISYIYDVGSYVKTLEYVKTLKASLFVPCHAEAAEDISPLCQYNIDKVYEIADKIKEICKTPLNFEIILQKLFAHYGLNMTFEQYVLVGSTVRSYLAWLRDKGELDVEFSDNMMLWKTL